VLRAAPPAISARQNPPTPQSQPPPPLLLLGVGVSWREREREMAAPLGERKVERLSSIDAQLRMLVPGKVSEDDKLIEYDALLLDRFLDILQDLHGHDLRELVSSLASSFFFPLFLWYSHSVLVGVGSSSVLRRVPVTVFDFLFLSGLSPVLYFSILRRSFLHRTSIDLLVKGVIFYFFSLSS
jgi:hypothetical protein